MATNPIAQAISPFIWGRGGAALTPEQVAREREVAEALMAQGIDTSPVGHWTQGAARMANVLAGKLKEGRASSAESAGRTAFSDRLSSILGGSPATSTAMATAPAPDYASARVAQAHNAGGATVPTGERAEYIRQGLLNRGLPGHVADAFLMNFKDESGLNPGINEVAPLVPGSRGGYGLYQLTGPRRREYEAFAAERGSPLDDIDTQLDFLMREGSGSERAAFERILAAPDTGTAATEIVNRFLRPAQAHRESRAARYSRAPNTAVGANEAMAAGSLAGVPVAEAPQDIIAQEAAMAAQDPMAFQQPAMPMAEPRMVSDMPIADIAQSLTRATVNPDLPMAGNTSGFLPVAQSLAAQPQQQGGMPNMQHLIDLASDPWATDAQRQVVGALLQQQMQAADPMRQAQLEKLRLETDQLRSGSPGANSSFGNLDAQARAAGLTPGSPEYQDFMLHGGGAPATFRALDMQAQAAGFTPGTPEYNEFMATRGAGLQAGAAQMAKNVADIDTGGAAAGAKIGGQKTMEAGFDAWKDYGKLQTSIGNMDEAIAALDSGAQTGIIYKMLPNITEASASLQNAMDRMGLDVIGSVTFGALSEGEMRLAMQTAVPRDLPPAELRSWLAKKRDAQIKAADMLADAAQFLTKPGNTINDWIERNRAAKKAQGTTGQSSTGIQWSIED